MVTVELLTVENRRWTVAATLQVNGSHYDLDDPHGLLDLEAATVEAECVIRARGCSP